MTGKRPSKKNIKSLNWIRKVNLLRLWRVIELLILLIITIFFTLFTILKTFDYLYQAAKMGHPIFKEVLKIAKGSASFPATILNPFGLLICLALTSVRQQSASILESLKSIISKVWKVLLLNCFIYLEFETVCCVFKKKKSIYCTWEIFNQI